jgi:uncharacterized protein YecE (DUF72 family)
MPETKGQRTTKAISQFGFNKIEVRKRSTNRRVQARSGVRLRQLFAPVLYCAMQGGIWIGTSGWVYKHWAESFYPDELKKADEFAFYATQFPTVEINATFYRLPTLKMVKGWRRKAPQGFLFAAKGSRFLTHMKKLRDVGDGLKTYIKRISPLEEHLGPILWQLPPNLHKDLERLENFLKKLPKKLQHAVEFRDPSWIDEETFSMLRKYNAAHVWLSSQVMPQNFTLTADFIYLRFHGLKNGAAHDYTKSELEPWAEQLVQNARTGKPAFVYFNNDWNTRAPLNAKMLMEMVGKFALQPFADRSEINFQRRQLRGKIKPDLTIPRSQRLRVTK